MQRKICQSSCHEYEGVWVVREGEGEDLAWRTNLNFGFVLFLVQKLENFALLLWAKFYLFFTLDKKIRCPKFSRGKMGTWRKWPFQTWLCQNLVLNFFQALKSFSQHILRRKYSEAMFSSWSLSSLCYPGLSRIGKTSLSFRNKNPRGSSSEVKLNTKQNNKEYKAKHILLYESKGKCFQNIGTTEENCFWLRILLLKTIRNFIHLLQFDTLRVFCEHLLPP